MMDKKRLGLLLVAIIALANTALIFGYGQYYFWNQRVNSDEFYFGISCGRPTAQEAKIQIDRVKNFTNLILINSNEISTNQTALNEVCDYAYTCNLKFIVFFSFISQIVHPWHEAWLEMAKVRWGDYFLGIHLRDELGGKQIDQDQIYAFTNASDYSDAANRFTQKIAQDTSMLIAKEKGIPLFISDYALYWFDYLAGYDVVLVELGWTINSTRQIALCRGAANMQGKDWGAHIVWTYYEPPYLGTPSEVYKDLVLAYRAGAKYVIIFDDPPYPDGNPHGVLSEEHFDMMKKFWSNVHAVPRQIFGGVNGEVALVWPKDYGWAMRRTEHLLQDRIWGLWPEDEMSPIVFETSYALVEKYGLKLDIVYPDERFNVYDKYSTVYYWNTTRR
jgi:hypothetical protein